MELKKTVVKSFGLFLGASIFSRAVQFISKIVLAFFLLPKDFGLFAIGFLFISVLEVFRSFGLEQFLIYTKRDLKKTVNSIFFVQISISLLLFVFLFSISHFAAVFFGKNPVETTEIEKIIRALSIVLIINSIGAVHGALLEKKMDFRKRIVPDIISSISYFVLAIALAANNFGIWSLVLATVSANLLYNFSMLVVSPLKISFDIDWSIGKELFGYGKFVLAAAILTFAITNLDVAAIGKILSAEMLGLYSMAATISVLLPTQLTFAISKVAFPAYSIIREEKNKVKEAYIKSIRYVSLFFFPLACLIIIVGPEFVSIVLGKNWTNPEMALSLQILAIAGFARAIGSVSTPIFLAIGKPKILSLGALVQLLALAIIIVPLTAAYGIAGTSIAITSTTIAITMYYVFWASKNIGFKKRELFFSTSKTFAAGLLLAALAILLGTFFFKEESLFNLAMVCVISGAFFSLLVWALEKATVLEIIQDIFPRKG